MAQSRTQRGSLDLVGFHSEPVTPGRRVPAPADLVVAEGDASLDSTDPFDPASHGAWLDELRDDRRAATTWLAERGVRAIFIGGTGPVHAEGFLDGGDLFYFAAQGTTAALWVYDEDQPIVLVEDLERDADGGLILTENGYPARRSRRATLAEVGAATIEASELAWAAWTDSQVWVSANPVVASGATVSELWPAYRIDVRAEGVTPRWSAHIDGADDFGWTDWEGGALSATGAARLLAHLTDAYAGDR